MALLSPGDWFRARVSGGAALLFWALAAADADSPAPRAEEENVYYSRQATFRIPFQVGPGDRRVQRVIRHVSEDQGRTYKADAEAGPGDRGFTFQARRDGWYFF